MMMRQALKAWADGLQFIFSLRGLLHPYAMILCRVNSCERLRRVLCSRGSAGRSRPSWYRFASGTVSAMSRVPDC
jgi:hypothetical protein